MLYLAITHGVYRQDILGIFQREKDAEKAAADFFASEKDHYHDVEIVTLIKNHPGVVRSRILSPPGIR